MTRITAALATCLLTVAPLAAQQLDQPPVVAPTAPVMEAPALPGEGQPPSLGTAPIAPGAEAAGPSTNSPVGLQPAGEAPATAAPSVAAPSVAPVTPAPTAAPTATPETAPAVPATDPAAAVPGATVPGAIVPATPVDAGAAPAPAPVAIEHGLQHDLSPYGMYMAADIIVKGVMIGLAVATFVTLTIFVYKFFEVAFAKMALRRSLRIIQNAATLSTAASSLQRRSDPAAFMTRAALDELKRSIEALDIAGNDGLKERTRSLIERTEAQAGRRLMRGTGVLATIGSTAPFVGLFGTVWGIMNSFVSIAETQTTNLAVVAPGIAEALLATAIGLVAAIPAVIIYNHFARQIQGYKLQLGDAGAGVERLLSRDLDFRNVAPAV